jgi:hypothetical protein
MGVPTAMGQAASGDCLIVLDIGSNKLPRLDPKRAVVDRTPNLQQQIGAPGAGRFPRHIELYFAGICAEHLVDSLSLAGPQVIRPAPMRLTD